MGLKMKAHPLLLDPVGSSAGGGGQSKSSVSKKDRFKPMAPKFASTRANARISTNAGGSGLTSEPVKANPYTTVVRTGTGTAPAAGGFEGVPKERVGRKLQFNTKGKYIAQGNQMRNQVRVDK